MTATEYAAQKCISVSLARTKLNKMVEEGKATCRTVVRETPVNGCGMVPIQVNEYTLLGYELASTGQLLHEMESLTATINALPVGTGIVLSKRVAAIIKELHRREELGGPFPPKNL